jgi:hypothetical protein
MNTDERRMNTDTAAEEFSKTISLLAYPSFIRVHP